MQAVSHLVKESLPNYLRDLPIPDSILGRYRHQCLSFPTNFSFLYGMIIRYKE